MREAGRMRVAECQLRIDGVAIQARIVARIEIRNGTQPTRILMPAFVVRKRSSCSRNGAGHGDSRGRLA